MKKKHQYLITVKYLGYRYHGWAKQTGLKTIQGELEKNIRYILQHDQFTTLGASRTDAMVSAEMNAFALFTDDELTDTFIANLNNALPQEIITTTIEEVGLQFNIINDSKSKTYHYHFSNVVDFDIFNSHLCTHVNNSLDIELMKAGAKLFLGEQSFHNFCFKPKPNTTFTRLINDIAIIENINNTYLLKVSGTGFLRHQIRIIMGTLLELGQNKIVIEDIKTALKITSLNSDIGFTAPASGLLLKQIDFESLPSLI